METMSAQGQLLKPRQGVPELDEGSLDKKTFCKLDDIRRMLPSLNFFFFLSICLCDTMTAEVQICICIGQDTVSASIQACFYLNTPSGSPPSCFYALITKTKTQTNKQKKGGQKVANPSPNWGKVSRLQQPIFQSYCFTGQPSPSGCFPQATWTGKHVTTGRAWKGIRKN